MPTAQRSCVKVTENLLCQREVPIGLSCASQLLVWVRRIERRLWQCSATADTVFSTPYGLDTQKLRTMLKSLQTASMCWNVTGFGCVLHLYSTWDATWSVDITDVAKVDGYIRDHQSFHSRSVLSNAVKTHLPLSSSVQNLHSWAKTWFASQWQLCSGGSTSPRPDCCPIWSACVRRLRLEQADLSQRWVHHWTWSANSQTLSWNLREESCLQWLEGKLDVPERCLPPTAEGWDVASSHYCPCAVHVLSMCCACTVHVLSFCWCGRGREGTEVALNVWHFA